MQGIARHKQEHIPSSRPLTGPEGQASSSGRAARATVRPSAGIARRCPVGAVPRAPVVPIPSVDRVSATRATGGGPQPTSPDRRLPTREDCGMDLDGIHLETLSIPNMRVTRPWRREVTTASLRTSLRRFPWFRHVGEDSAWDELIVRINGWSAWPGPEDDGCAALFEQQQELYDELQADDADGHLVGLFEEVRAEVVEMVKPLVPFDESEDAWHPPTTAVWSAGWTAGLVVGFHNGGHTPPDDLLEQWRWYEAGHWVAGYEARPGADLLRLVVY